MAVELRRRFRKLRASRDVFGLAGGLKVLLHSKLRFAPWDLFSVEIPGIQYEVHGRTRTSDPWVLQQIFLDHEYAPIDDQEQVSFVLDCGANVGYSSIYFLIASPAAECWPSNRTSRASQCSGRTSSRMASALKSWCRVCGPARWHWSWFATTRHGRPA